MLKAMSLRMVSLTELSVHVWGHMGPLVSDRIIGRLADRHEMKSNLLVIVRCIDL